MNELLLKNKRKILGFMWSAVRLLLLIGISYTILYPLMTKLVYVFMSQSDLTDYSITWIPKHFTFENLKITIEITDYWESLLTTVGLCGLVSLLQVTVATLAAYGFARYKSKSKAILFVIVLATLLIPPQTYMVTLYTQFKNFDIMGIIKLLTGSSVNVLDTVWTFILLSATGMGIKAGLYVYVTKQTFSGLPKELEEAAKVDGAGMFSCFTRVMLPNAVPTIVLCFILSFVWQWSDTVYTSFFSPTVKTLAMQMTNIRHLVSEYLGNWGMHLSSYGQILMAVGILLSVLPVVIVFVLCQKFFVQGVERSGLVG